MALHRKGCDAECLEAAVADNHFGIRTRLNVNLHTVRGRLSNSMQRLSTLRQV